MNAVACQVLSDAYGWSVAEPDILPQSPGFSGAQVYRIRHAGCDYCLRRWPKNSQAQMIGWIHRRLQQFLDAGETRLSVPLSTVNDQSLVTINGIHWELSPWLPGVADFHTNKDRDRLQSALRTLAEVHLTAERFSAVTDLPQPVVKRSSTGIAQRFELLERTLAGRLATIRKAVESGTIDRNSNIHTAATEIIDSVQRLGPDIARELRLSSSILIRQCICLRDIWHDHILFTGDRVTGIVDYDAMRMESPAGDLARLLGSLVENDAGMWAAGLAAYNDVRQLDSESRQLISAFDQGNVMLSGLQWLEWRFVEFQPFAHTPAADQRILHWWRRISVNG